MAKHYRHQDTKAQKKLLTNGVPSCLSVFVATFPARPGYIYIYISEFL
jgi:hypothetical protein